MPPTAGWCRRQSYCNDPKNKKSAISKRRFEKNSSCLFFVIPSLWQDEVCLLGVLTALHNQEISQQSESARVYICERIHNLNLLFPQICESTVLLTNFGVKIDVRIYVIGRRAEVAGQSPNGAE
jgi:hypothetical protein